MIIILNVLQTTYIHSPFNINGVVASQSGITTQGVSDTWIHIPWRSCDRKFACHSELGLPRYG